MVWAFTSYARFLVEMRGKVKFEKSKLGSPSRGGRIDWNGDSLRLKY